MYQRFLTFVRTNKLLENEDRLLLGVSGGVDSMVLAHLVLKTKMTFGVAHVNYKLRNSASEKDAELVRLWCQHHKIPFYLREVDPKVYHSGKSIQMVAREIRYDFYAELVENEVYTKVLTAHNANDNLETVLFNLTKGTGVSGLTGIAARKHNIVRPLLFASKEAIYAYARKEKISWREDASNVKNDYSRNLIRNQVIPLLKEINPALETTFSESLSRFKGAAELIYEEKKKILSKHLQKNGDVLEMNLSWIKNDTKSLLLLSEILKDFRFNFKDAKDLFQTILYGRSGAFFYSAEFVINFDRERFFIFEQKEEPLVDLEIKSGTGTVSTPYYTLSFEEISGRPREFGGDNVAFLDAGLIAFPLKVRNWREGDRFSPLGMTGKKKISDFMIDSKIAVSLKRKVLILESRGKILWVIGHRIDDRFKVTPQTSKILKIEIGHA